MAAGVRGSLNALRETAILPARSAVFTRGRKSEPGAALRRGFCGVVARLPQERYHSISATYRSNRGRMRVSLSSSAVRSTVSRWGQIHTAMFRLRDAFANSSASAAIDVVHCHGLFAGGFILFLARMEDTGPHRQRTVRRSRRAAGTRS